jgi:polyhydroxyalkanoate synthesis regulator phasin
MKKRLLLAGGIVLAAVVLFAFAAPVLAQTRQEAGTAQTQIRPAVKRVLARLLLIQNEARVDSVIAQAAKSGKITAEQATRIKEFWTENHQPFTKKVVLTRLIWAKDGAKVHAFLDKAVSAGKMKQEQADKLMAFWNAVHTR